MKKTDYLIVIAILIVGFVFIELIIDWIASLIK